MGEPPFPAAPGVLNAPSSWRCIDFISDLHLQASLPKTAKRLADYLAHTPADAVLILGDLFEAWVGDDMRLSGFEAEVTSTLANAGRRLYLGIMVGNRDFLMGADLMADCSAHWLDDPTILTAWGQGVLLTHGDALCLADQDYLRVRQGVRQPAWQAAFLARPLAQRLDMARQMRAASQAHQHAKPMSEWADVDEAAAAAWMSASNARSMIHGHTHRPGSEPFGVPGGERHVLSDWDLDEHEHPRGEVLRLDAGGFHRVSLLSSQ